MNCLLAGYKQINVLKILEKNVNNKIISDNHLMCAELRDNLHIALAFVVPVNLSTARQEKIIFFYNKRI